MSFLVARDWNPLQRALGSNLSTRTAFPTARQACLSLHHLVHEEEINGTVTIFGEVIGGSEL